MMRYFLAALSAALLLASPASAQKSWTGCGLTAIGGYSATKTEVNVASVLVLDGLGGDGPTYGIGAVCDYQTGSVVVGAFIDHTWSDADFNLRLSTLAFSAGIEQLTTVGARAGYDTGGALIYALAGYGWGDVGASLITLPDVSGWVVGGGIETRIGDQVTIGAEYRAYLFESESLAGGLASMETTHHTVTARLTWRPSLGN